MSGVQRLGTWFSRIWTGQDKVTCPFCLRECRLKDNETTCNAVEGCGREIPRLYLANYRELPPLFVPIIGWPECGKTCSLISTVQTIRHMNRLWEGFSYDYPNKETLDWIRQFVIAVAAGHESPPDRTQKETQPSFIIPLRNLPERWRGPGCHGRTLVIRDFSGELFRQIGSIAPDQFSFLRQSRTLTLMYDLANLISPQPVNVGYTLDQLLSVYCDALMNEPGSGKATNSVKRIQRMRLNVIVVLSQADKLLNDPRFPSHLAQYLKQDPIADAVAGRLQIVDGNGTSPHDPFGGMPASNHAKWPSTTMNEYLEVMGRASDAIQEYLVAQSADAENLVANAKEYGIRLRFALTSAIGEDAAESKAIWRPTRILDPLFHALDFEVATERASM